MKASSPELLTFVVSRMFHDGQHSRFNDRHRQQADACGRA
jgi:hypothetical protein